MINEIITAISTLIANEFPAPPIYINNIGEGFERPSFFITHISDTADHLTRDYLENNQLIQVVYYAPWDDYQNVDTVDQYNTYDRLKAMLSNGYIKVNFNNENRAVKIKQYTGGPRDAEIYLTLNLDTTSDKINVSQENKTPMGEIIFNQNID